MKLNLQRQFHLAALIVIPASFVGPLSLPASSQDALTIAQVLDGTSSSELTSVETVAQNFFTALAQQNFEQAKQYLSPDLKDYASAAQMQQVWQDLISETGTFIKVDQISSTELLGNYTLWVTVQFEGSTEDLVLKLNQDQQITAVDFMRLGNIEIIAKQFVDALGQGDYALARSYLSSDLKQQFLPETIQQRWETVLSKTGPFQQSAVASVSRSSDYDVVAMNVEFANYSGKFLVLFNPLGQIVKVNSPLTQSN